MTETSVAARFVATHSVLTLDARHPFVAKSLVDAQEMHRTVMSGFRGWVEDGSPDARSQMGVLSTWSVDLKAAALVLVVQSRVAGDWSAIPRDAFVRGPRVITVDRTVRVGEALAFRAVLNPSRSVPGAGPPGARGRSRRIAHTTPKHARDWFARRLQPEGEPRVAPDGVSRIGADTDPESLSVRMLPAVTSASAKKGLRIARVEIRGALTVTDPGPLIEAMGSGIGHARAYGCGLLLIR
ncbi:type I-E CRISPR-associated protein Cas6/Cse3/CasE [Nocardiopsis alba]|uniref:CRISPR-associated protein Cas6/Cse3/CasE n=1 Tax=Nocardiopsis alba (strain ATCC BAA-2165 / BE74) TaxID=1205910 RepID=J7L987_NOCAA|nr:type I-E CRISPR-associated protein Cas6/Cse3/CasE [Nocardiopsis alba]AFR07995.1 CRISPR-associated protein Cas6/Cse3/CasE [Nocardiopsis alba ATCC BAA-2165]